MPHQPGLPTGWGQPRGQKHPHEVIQKSAVDLMQIMAVEETAQVPVGSVQHAHKQSVPLAAYLGRQFACRPVRLEQWPLTFQLKLSD